MVAPSSLAPGSGRTAVAGVVIGIEFLTARPVGPHDRRDREPEIPGGNPGRCRAARPARVRSDEMPRDELTRPRQRRWEPARWFASGPDRWREHRWERDDRLSAPGTPETRCPVRPQPEAR